MFWNDEAKRPELLQNPEGMSERPYCQITALNVLSYGSEASISVPLYVNVQSNNDKGCL